MKPRVVVRLAAMFVLCAAAPAAARETRSPLHGSLTPGPHAVGFATVPTTDPTRLVKPKRDANGRGETADRSRRLTIHLWYPSKPGSAGKAMTLADAMTAHLSDRPEEASRRDTDVRTFLGQFGAITDDRWNRLLATPLLARRDDVPAQGPFPLIVGQLRRLSTNITNEYLASHGYVVAMVYGDEMPGVTEAGPGLETATRDMELTIAEIRKRSYIDQGALAALGFSGARFSQILLAMRHPDIDAVCDLESAIFDDRIMWPLQRGWGYDLAALRVPFLHTYSVPLSKLERRIADFEGMRYSTRYRYLVDAPGIHHWDFATEGMAASTVLNNRGDAGPKLRQAFEATNRYVLAFFNAYVKHDQQELAFLRRDPAANGAAPGLATIRELPAVQPAPTTEAFTEMITANGISAAMATFDEARARDPQAALFREDRLNMLGYRLLRGKRPVEAVTILRKNAEMYPVSANTYDSLGEALEASGEREEALQVTRRGLEVLAKQELSPAERQRMADLLQARLKRLS